ncbi:hypothetical protein TI39_contig354g00088 [Zymoseptoria brevis]|uniref:ABC transmembrane type-1 domain-containing protein n=1 Tax=Zymoseptoria brevis TaxID=1047168 RepID=A0A0F4GQ31_9PEZI|nr:hypothetical protein TI39_contig354g00088 [Zymoseptoria brevis]
MTVVIGPPGSGKTTLLKALLGEVGCATGTIALATKSVAYRAQSPWVTDMTIAQYIRGPDEVPDHTWYQDVLRACQLTDDLRNQPEGDNTRIGRWSHRGSLVNSIAATNSPFRGGDRTIIAVSLSAKLIDVADRVFRLKDGALTELDRGLGSSLATIDDIQRTHCDDEKEPRSVAHAATKPPSPETKQDMIRHTGDCVVFLTIMPSSASKLHQVLLNTVARAPYSLFYNTDTGKILNKFSQDMSHVCNSLPTPLISTGNTLCETIASLVLISIGASYMGFTIPFVLVTIFIPALLSFSGALEGVVTIRSLGWSEHTEKTNRRLLDESQAPAYLPYCVQRWLRLVLDMTTMALAVVVVALAVTVRDTTSPGRLALALTNILSFSQSLSRLITEWTTMETSVGSVPRLRSFASDPDFMPQRRSLEGTSASLDTRWPSQGWITLNRVYAKYDTKDVHDRDCLRDISLEIQAGTKVSVRGRTGSGKTSLTLALFQVLPLRSDSIVIDDVDISTLSVHQLQECLIGVPQQAFIMPDSIRRNLDPSGMLSDHDLNAVLSKVALQEVIEQLGGLDAALYQTRLSQGPAATLLFG